MIWARENFFLQLKDIEFLQIENSFLQKKVGRSKDS